MCFSPAMAPCCVLCSPESFSSPFIHSSLYLSSVTPILFLSFCAAVKATHRCSSQLSPPPAGSHLTLQLSLCHFSSGAGEIELRTRAWLTHRFWCCAATKKLFILILSNLYFTVKALLRRKTSSPVEPRCVLTLQFCFVFACELWEKVHKQSSAERMFRKPTVILIFKRLVCFFSFMEKN